MAQLLGRIRILVFLAMQSIGANPSLVVAQELPPYRGTMVGANDGDLLDFECSEISTGRIECNFVQVLLRTKSTQEEFEASLASIPDILKEMESDTDFCDFILAYDRVAKGETLDDQEMAEKVRNALEEQLKSGLKDERSLEKVDLIEEALIEICENPSTETARNFLEASHNIESDVCEAMFNRYTQQFVQVSEGLWVVESTPSGECGIINTSRFTADPKYPMLWNYEASKIITNKSGGEIIPCSGLDERPQPYFWNQGPVLKNCTYLD